MKVKIKKNTYNIISEKKILDKFSSIFKNKKFNINEVPQVVLDHIQDYLEYMGINLDDLNDTLLIGEIVEDIIPKMDRYGYFDDEEGEFVLAYISSLHRKELMKIMKQSLLDNVNELVNEVYKIDDKIIESFSDLYIDSDTDEEKIIFEFFGIFDRFKKKKVSHLAPEAEKRFAEFKKHINNSVNLFKRMENVPGGERNRLMAAKVIFKMLNDRKNPVQILKNMTNLGYESEDVWYEVTQLVNSEG